MKDRFRFRAWNKEEKEMYYDAENTYDYMAGKPIIFAESFSCLLTNDEVWEVEQCTGLKDKNGNLIYEGDIVKSMIRAGYIKWNKGNMTWFVYVLKSNEIIALNSYLDGELEIIGNIHEQPEQKDK